MIDKIVEPSSTNLPEESFDRAEQIAFNESITKNFGKLKMEYDKYNRLQ